MGYKYIADPYCAEVARVEAPLLVSTKLDLREDPTTINKLRT